MFITANDLGFGYDQTSKKVIDGLDLEIEKGTFTAIIGHNGSGKSTLAKLLCGILTPTSGKVTVGGFDTSDAEHAYDIRRMCGMVFQNPDNQIVAGIVEEDVAFAPENLGLPSREIRRRVDEALKTVGMTEYAHHPAHKLSGGQKQRVAIAGMLAMQPECIVFDEATAMLDPVGRREINTVMRDICRQKGITVITITHYMNEAADADRVIVLDRGRLMLDGTPREVFSHVEDLKKAGLSVPQVTELMYMLELEGIDTPHGILHAMEAADFIERNIKK